MAAHDDRGTPRRHDGAADSGGGEAAGSAMLAYAAELRDERNAVTFERAPWGAAAGWARASGTCAWCGRASRRLARCLACLGAAYCDRACQKRAWPAHRAACHAAPPVVVYVTVHGVHSASADEVELAPLIAAANAAIVAEGGSAAAPGASRLSGYAVVERPTGMLCCGERLHLQAHVAGRHAPRLSALRAAVEAAAARRGTRATLLVRRRPEAVMRDGAPAVVVAAELVVGGRG